MVSPMDRFEAADIDDEFDFLIAKSLVAERIAVQDGRLFTGAQTL